MGSAVDGYSERMGDYSTVGIWTRCPACADEAVAVVQFGSHGERAARLIDFRCPTDCPVDAHSILRRVRLTSLDRAS
jgi:hypothetical protein